MAKITLVCPICQKEFYKNPSSVNGKNCCSYSCARKQPRKARLPYTHNKPHNNYMEFWLNVNKTETCWLWTGQLSKAGYGLCLKLGVDRLAHRHSYLILVGDIPKGLELDHLCHVRNCINPAHLEPVTHSENMRRQVRPKTHTKRTECRRGHPYIEGNFYLDKNGKRHCKICDWVWQRKNRRKDKII